MAVDPDPLAERHQTIPRSELEMDDQQTLEATADIDSKLMEQFDL